jgi:hypothetical protein
MIEVLAWMADNRSMVIRFLVIGAFLVMTQGCGEGLGTQTAPTVVGFSPAATGAILKALQDLQAAGITEAPPTLVTLDPSIAPDKGRACMNCDFCQIQVREEFDHGILKSIVWHELGHCAGLQHLTERADIMNPLVVPFHSYSDSSVQDFLVRLAAEL